MRQVSGTNRKNTMIDNFTKKNLTEFSEFQKTRNATHVDWLKNILTISTAILAVLISLKSEKSDNLIERIFYLSTISLSGIGILSGVIVLYAYVELDNLTLKKKNEQVLLLLDKKEIDSVVSIDMPKFYKPSLYICNISLFLSLISLLIYGFVSEI